MPCETVDKLSKIQSPGIAILAVTTQPSEHPTTLAQGKGALRLNFLIVETLPMHPEAAGQDSRRADRVRAGDLLGPVHLSHVSVDPVPRGKLLE